MANNTKHKANLMVMNEQNLLKRATFLPEKRSSVDFDPGPSFVMMPNEPEGIVSPTLMVVMFLNN